MLLAAWISLLLTQTVAAPSVTILSGADLRRAIQGAPEARTGHPELQVVQLSEVPGAQVVGIRRTAPASVEQHARFTDIWYVIQGHATLVTGGTVVDGVEDSPGELRGRRIAKGETTELEPGAFAVIPAGIPHWISAIDGPEFLYLVVKVPAGA